MASETAHILFIDDEEGMCRMVEAVLGDCGYRVTTFTDPIEGVAAYRPELHDIVISDVKMPGIDGLEVLERIRSVHPQRPIIMITAHATVDTSIQALRKGAYDMLTKPFEPDELIHRVKNALAQDRLADENRELKEQIAEKESFSQLVGQSKALREVLDTAEKIAPRDFPVLITGESGTGKELVAQLIHRASHRRERKFVAINCGALPQTLLESELFGAKKGAFTGANEERIGLIQAADGGTLFLDEVGNLPINVQKLMLRFLQEKEFYRLGDTTPIRVDVRIVAATNADLLKEVEKGTFREDLYYRLAVGKLKLPTLSERIEDIPLLAAHMIREQNSKFPTQVTGITPEAMEALTRHSWPGNVRQLKNVLDASMALETTERITPASLRQFLELGGAAAPCAPDTDQDYTSSLGKFEADYFGDLLVQFEGNVEGAAERAGVNLATFYRKMKKYGLKR